MVTTALYHWNVAGSPVNILIDLPLVDRFRVASTSSEQEIGGLLLGHFDGNYTVITDFDPVECEHRRGAAYTLSQRDEQRLGARIETRTKRGATVVGFFRSHARPGMFLDEGDNSVLSSYFNNPSQVALLIRPSSDRSATGGFFFWEDGEMNRKQTYLQFPMNARELELGDFPLVEPVAAAPIPSTPVADFENAETIDSFPRPAAVPVEEPATAFPEPRRFPTREIDAAPGNSSSRKVPWPIIGVIAAGAAFGGYLIGTSGSHSDRFGARSGDLTVNSAPEPQTVTAPQPITAPQPTITSQPVTAPQPPPTKAMVPSASVAPDPEMPTAGKAPMSVEPPATTKPPVKPAPLPSITPKPVPAYRTATLTRVPVTQPPVAAKLPLDSAPDTTSSDRSSAAWQHFHAVKPAEPARVAERAPVPAQPLAVPVPPKPAAAEASVSLEAVESGSIGRAFGRIPLFGAIHHARSGDNFIPPQAVSSFAPKVPHELARELTGPIPVDLKLTVDKSGHVSSVEIISHQAANEFVRLAGDAAYDWKFEPARLKDKPVSSDVIAHFRFRPLL